LTEAVALTVPEVLVGATDYCTHPAGLTVARVGGSKYPDLARILALKPDVVLMNVEENRLSDAVALEAAGVRIYRTYPLDVDDALRELGELLAFLGLATEPPWLTAARAAWASTAPVTQAAVIAVWRKPWIVLGRDTFAGDVLRRLGVGNAFGGDPERYPRPSIEEILARRPGLVVLPDEPYAFTQDDGPQHFPGVRCAFVSGRHLTWYGPSLAEAPALLRRQLCSGQL
jgi:ABC-type Fe3+-hydroxamate transport system substrate-binding protein